MCETRSDWVDLTERLVIWPCNHGGVLVEPMPVPLHYQCATCGAKPVEYARVPTEGAQDAD